MREGIDCKGRKWIERELKGRAENLYQHEFTYLTPILPVRLMDNKRTGWLCLCRCGNELAIETGKLKNKNTTSCGCRHKEIVRERWKQIRTARVGSKFNSLLIKRLIGHFGPDQTIYEFECLKCGRIFQRTWESVYHNKTKDCGCTLLQRKAELRDSLIGEKIEKLTVKRFVGMNEHHDYLYECECECGNTKIVSRDSLIKRNTQSCGCLVSMGENSITNILEENLIPFQKQVSFPDLISPLGGLLRYDFAILDNENNVLRLIEFDGKQHEKPYDYFGGEEKFQKIQTNDNLKNQYAFEHNIPLIRIPYIEKDNITLDLLLGDKYLLHSPS